MSAQNVQHIIERSRVSLVIAPTLPSWLVDLNPYTNCILGHRDSVLMLLENNFAGLLVRGGKVDMGLGKSRSDSCLFVPSPKLSSIFLLKSVSRIPKGSENSFVDAILNDSKDQLVALDTSLATNFSQLNGESFLLNIVIYTNKTASYKELRKRSDTLNQCKFDSLQLNCLKVKSVSINTANSAINLLKKASGSHQRNVHSVSDVALSKLFECLLQYEGSEELVLRQDVIKGPCGVEVEITNRKSVIDAFNIYFPQKDSKLELVPDVDRIMDNLLYCTDDQGRLLPLDKTGCYQGEVEFFILTFLKQLEEPSGLLLKNFNQNSLDSLMQFKKGQRLQFEVDWLYCGNDTIVAFEVGMTEWPMNPVSTVGNKLIQSITKLLPALQYLVFSLLTAGQGQKSDADPTIVDLVRDRLFVVTLLPNISGKLLQIAFKALKEKGGLSKIEARLSNLSSIVLIACNENGCLEQFKINSSMELEQTNFDVSKLTRNAKSRNETAGEIEYVSGLFALSVLHSDTNWKLLAQDVDLDGKFSQTISAKSAKNEAGSYFLTPEQLRILDEGKSFVLIRGEPGSGKTYLLLEKLKRLVREDDTHLVVIACDPKQQAFISFIRNCLRAPCFDGHQSKIVLREIPLDTLVKGLASRHRKMHSSEIDYSEPPERLWLHNLMDAIGDIPCDWANVAVLLDEVYTSALDYGRHDFLYNEKDELVPAEVEYPPLRCVWMCRIEDGTVNGRGPDSDTDLFCVESLHVLLRCAKHINEFAQNLIYSQRASTNFGQVFIDNSLALVTSVFISSQNAVPWEYFGTLEQLQQMVDLLDKRWEQNRMFVVFGKNTGIGEQVQQYVEHKSSSWFLIEQEESLYASTLPRRYGGIEAASVVVIVLDVDIPSEGSLVSAVTRGQFEAAVFVLEDLKDTKMVKKLLEGVEHNQDLEVYKDIASGRAVKNRYFEALSIEEKCEMARLVKDKLGKTRQPSLSRSSYLVQLQFHCCYYRLNFLNLWKNFNGKSQDEVDVNSIKSLAASAIDEQRLLGQEDFGKLDLLAFSCITGNLEILNWAIDLATKHGSLEAEVKGLHQTNQGLVPIVFLLNLPMKISRASASTFKLNTPNYWKCFQRIIQAGFPIELLAMPVTKGSGKIIVSVAKYIGEALEIRGDCVFEVLGPCFEYLFPSVDNEEFIDGHQMKHKVVSDPDNSILIRAYRTRKPDCIKGVLSFLEDFFFEGISKEMQATYSGNRTALDIVLQDEDVNLDCFRALFDGGFNKVYFDEEFRSLKGHTRLLMKAFNNFHLEIFHFLLLNEVSLYVNQFDERVYECEDALENSHLEHWFSSFLGIPVNTQMLNMRNSRGISFVDLLPGTAQLLTHKNFDLFHFVTKRRQPGKLYEICKLADLKSLTDTLRTYGITPIRDHEVRFEDQPTGNPAGFTWFVKYPDNLLEEIKGRYDGNSSLVSILLATGKATIELITVLYAQCNAMQVELTGPIRINNEIYANGFEMAKTHCNRDVIRYLVYPGSLRPPTPGLYSINDLGALLWESKKLRPEWLQSESTESNDDQHQKRQSSYTLDCGLCQRILDDFGLSEDPTVRNIENHSSRQHTTHEEYKVKLRKYRKQWMKHLRNKYPNSYMYFPDFFIYGKKF